MRENSIVAHSLSRAYGAVKAIDSLSFEIGKGELFGFIGPDGSGKTTLFRMLVTLLLPDSGIASVDGFDIIKDYRKIRQIIGYMPGRFSLYQDLTVEQNLSFFATIFGTTVQENYHLVKDIYSHLEPFKDRLAGKLSGGMKQKLALSCCLIHKPHVLILDEPTTGVDAVSRKEFWEILRKLKKEGITIVVSTAYMDEASLCDRVALLQDGKILAIDQPEKIKEYFHQEIYAVQSADLYLAVKDMREFSIRTSAYLFGQDVHVSAEPGCTSIQEIAVFLNQRGHKSVIVKQIPPGIEDCFIGLMQPNHRL